MIWKQLGSSQWIILGFHWFEFISLYCIKRKARTTVHSMWKNGNKQKGYKDKAIKGISKRENTIQITTKKS